MTLFPFARSFSISTDRPSSSITSLFSNSETISSVVVRSTMKFDSISSSVRAFSYTRIERSSTSAAADRTEIVAGVSCRKLSEVAYCLAPQRMPFT